MATLAKLITKQTVGQMSSDFLRDVLQRTKNKRLIEVIRTELDSREAVGKDEPLSIEDFLG